MSGKREGTVEGELDTLIRVAWEIGLDSGAANSPAIDAARAAVVKSIMESFHDAGRLPPVGRDRRPVCGNPAKGVVCADGTVWVLACDGWSRLNPIPGSIADVADIAEIRRGAKAEAAAQ